MKNELLLDTARNQLNLVLSFFSRVDAKASVVLAVNTGMAGYLASKFPSPSTVSRFEVIVGLAVFVLIGLSLWHLYKVAFPNLVGGHQSLVYFREIAQRTEAKYIDEFSTQSESELAKDLLGQAWRNSEILTQKFSHLKSAFLFMAIALFPWIIALIMFGIQERSNS
jgi:hypothetical protein